MGDNSFYLLLAGAVAVLLLYIINLAITAKTSRACKPLSRITYILAILLILLNTYRMMRISDGTMVAANIAALLAVVIAFVRSEKASKEHS